MNYTAFITLFFFLPFVVFVHYLIQNTKLRRMFFCITSLLMYVWFSISYVDIIQILFLVAVSYLFSKVLQKQPNQLMLLIYISYVIMQLGFFKFGQYFTQNNLIMPLGISFISFQAISYVVDVYQGKIKEINALDCLNYLLFFPTAFLVPFRLPPSGI